MDRLNGKPDHVALIFVDGLGWGGADPALNPCLTYGGDVFRLDGADPGGFAGADPRPAFGGGWARPIDACLGVDGIPQSATGQTSLFTGVNAQAKVGGHVTGFPSPSLREILLADSIFVKLRDAGRDGIFINAFRPLFFEIPREMQLRLSATTVAHLAADRPFFGIEDIREGRSIYQEFTNRELIERDFDVPEFTPERAGQILAGSVAARDFTLFEYFQTDRAGHSQDRGRIEGELDGLDRFMRKALDELIPRGDTLVVLTSDHGNIEDIGTRSHTRNPVPLLAWGPGAEELVAGTEAIDGVTPALLRGLGAL